MTDSPFFFTSDLTFVKKNKKCPEFNYLCAIQEKPPLQLLAEPFAKRVALRTLTIDCPINKVLVTQVTCVYHLIVFSLHTF